MEFMVRSLLGMVKDSNFSLIVVQVMRDGSRMLNKEFSTVFDSWLYTMYVYLCNIYQCSVHYSA
jgi:hypothetical protein